jgi:hypothetical protein
MQMEKSLPGRVRKLPHKKALPFVLSPPEIG